MTPLVPGKAAVIVEHYGASTAVTVIQWADTYVDSLKPKPIKPIAAATIEPAKINIAPKPAPKPAPAVADRATSTARRTVEIRSEINSILMTTVEQAIVRVPDPELPGPCPCEPAPE